MAIKYKITMTDIPPADTDAALGNDLTTPEIAPPPGGAWKLQYSVRGEYKLHHFWMQGTTDFHEGAETYWTGRGDNITTGEVGTGDPLIVELAEGQTHAEYEVYLNPEVPTWLYGGQVVWEDANGYVSAEIVAKATPLQAVTNASLALNGPKVYYVGPGNGTHEFAGTPTLVKALDGDGLWNYSETTGLTPAAAADGSYNIYTVDITVSRFINSIWVKGTNHTYKEFKNASAWQIPPGYVIKIIIDNEGATSWNAHLLLNLIRYTTV